MHLRACPFCGGEAGLKERVPHRGNSQFHVQCARCGSRTPVKASADQVADLWNGILRFPGRGAWSIPGEVRWPEL